MSAPAEELAGWSDGLRRQLLEAARAAAPKEACGLLVRGADGQLRAPAAANHAGDPERSFEIDPAAVLRWSTDPGVTVVGTWHSHPEGPPTPSRADLEGHGLGGWMAIVGRGADRAWRVALFSNAALVGARDAEQDQSAPAAM